MTEVLENVSPSLTESVPPPPAPTQDTDAERVYQRYVERWIGIPWVLNGTDKATGLDCRTLACAFLKGQGIAVKEDDGQPLPATIDELDVTRFETAIKDAGTSVPITQLQRNDLVYYRNRHGRLHIGVWLGYGKMLTTDVRTGSLIIRMRPEWLQGAVRGREGAWLDLPPGHDLITAILAAIGSTVTFGVATGTAAVIIGAITVAATAASIGFGIGAMNSARRAFNFDTAQSLSSSPRYSFDGARNVRSNQYPVPLIYGAGSIRILQTYEIWNSGQGAEEQKRCVVVAVGELGGISGVELNGEAISGFSGSSATAYVGTATQGIDSRLANSGITSLRHRAYIAVTLKGSDKLGGDPLITCTLDGGRKIKTWSASTWSGSTVSGNPAAIVRDYLTLSREVGGCGFEETRMCDTCFGDVYDWAEVSVPNGLGGTEPRARLVYGIDSFRPWLDNLQDTLATFGGFLISDGRVFHLKVEKDESPVQSFTEDNMLDVSYQTFSKEERPNRVIGKYIDPSTEGNDAPARVQVEDFGDQDVNPRGINPREVNLLGLQRQSQCIREITKALNDAKVNWYTIAFTTDINAIALEPGDIFQATHSILGDGLTAYKFRAFRLLEQPDHRVKIIGKAFTGSIFNDQLEQNVVTLDYTPPPNPFLPVADVSGLGVSATGFLQVDGAFISNLQVNWTEPIEKINLKHYALEWSENGGAYQERAVVLAGSTVALLPGAKVGASYTVRVRTVNRYDVKSDGATSSSVTVDGKTAAPSDVQNFNVQQLGDELVITWDAIQDVDRDEYEIREGGTDWASAGFVVRLQSTEHRIRDFTAGTKTFRIKAIDASGNPSLNAASDSILADPQSTSNIVDTFDIFDQGLADGVFSAGAELQLAALFSTAFRRPVIGIKTILRVDTYASTYTQLQTDLNWDTEQRETTQENYTSRVRDLGSIQSVVFGAAFKYLAGNGTVTLQWAKSDTDANPSTFVNFVGGVYTVRYYKVRLLIQTNDTTKNVQVYECSVVADVKDKEERFVNQAIAAAGTLITFTKAYATAPAVNITVLGTTPLVPRAEGKTNLSMTVKLRNQTSGVDEAGNVDITVRGA